MPDQAASQPDYGTTLNQLQQLQYMLQSDSSPLLGELKQHMAPYQGKVSPEEYQRMGGQFVQNWVAQNMFGGRLPTREDFDGPLRDFEYGKRAEALMADPAYAKSAGGKTREQLITELRHTTPQPLEKQLHAMEALWSLVPSEGPKQKAVEMPPIEMKSAPRKATFKPAAAKPKQKRASSLPADASDDQRLGESGLMLLQQLGGPPIDFYGK